jgi:uncharacterized membrane protein YdjX (TVP38/TMEM64 family)
MYVLELMGIEFQPHEAAQWINNHRLWAAGISIIVLLGALGVHKLYNIPFSSGKTNHERI